ncbi:MAG: glycosyltransferase family 4 protein, partial [Candidatus Bathyarchaeia archaeon]
PQGLIGIILKWLFKKPLVTRVFSADLLRAKSIGLFLISLITKIFAISDRVLPNSDYTKRLIPQFPSLMEKTATIREGVDLDKFKPTKVCKSLERKKLLTVARLVERKGIRYLLYAMKNVTKKTTNIELFIAGEGPERRSLEKLVQQLNLQKYIIFTGKVSDEELIRHYASSDIFILPSTEEALGEVLLEAMCMGIPVVASNTGGIPEIVIDHKTGILTLPGNSEALANSIMFLLDNPKICSEYGKNGHKFVFENFTWDKIARYFEKAFYETLKPG